MGLDSIGGPAINDPRRKKKWLQLFSRMASDLDVWKRLGLVVNATSSNVGTIRGRKWDCDLA